MDNEYEKLCSCGKVRFYWHCHCCNSEYWLCPTCGLASKPFNPPPEKPLEKDLKLVSIDDLIAEIFNRSVIAVIGYMRHSDPGDPFIYINWSEGSEMGKVGLCEAIKHRILCERDKREDK